MKTALSKSIKNFLLFSVAKINLTNISFKRLKGKLLLTLAGKAVAFTHFTLMLCFTIVKHYVKP